jgi:hypothetical protein
MKCEAAASICGRKPNCTTELNVGHSGGRATSARQRAVSVWGKLAVTRFSFACRSLLAAGTVVGVVAAGVAIAQTPSPTGASVYFINLKDGDTVTSPFKVQFGLTGMGIAPAGVEKEKTGHHHLLIDTTLSAEEMKGAIAADPQHVHFGGGQTETTVTLPPGQHTLQLVLGDWSHIPHSPAVMSPVITVTVK